MNRMVNHQHRDSSDLAKQFDNSDLSLGERLRQTEFIDSNISGGANREVSNFEMKKIGLPGNKYISDDSQTDSSNMQRIRNTIL